MRIDRPAHIPWILFVVVATVVSAALYVANFHPDRLPFPVRLPPFFGETPPAHGTVGGTPLGLIFGAVSFGIFIFAALLSLRKKLPHYRMGTVQRWVRGHIWLTLLTVPLILFHSGFALGGPMTSVLMTLYAVVMASGVYGLVLQQRIPTLMKEQLPAEIVYEQIPNIRAQLCAAAERLLRAYSAAVVPAKNSAGKRPAAATALPAIVLPDAPEHAVLKTPSAAEKPMGSATVVGTSVEPAAIVAGAEPEAATAAILEDDPVDPESEITLARMLENQVLPYLKARRGERYRLGHPRYAADTFRHLRLRVAAPYRARVDEMEGWCVERRLLDAQTRMQHWLHGWLLVHVPFSFLLLLMTAWHAFVTLFVY